MLSLRAIARSAPLRASRIAPSSKLIRPSFQGTLLVRSSQFSPLRQATATAAFSTTRSRSDEHSNYLAAKLSKEIELETEESAAGAGSDSNVEEFLAENPSWNVTDVEGGQEVVLTKEYEGEEVTVHFSISDFNSVMPGDEGIEDDSLADEEDMDMQSGGANTKGAINQGRSEGGNFKIAPEDSVAPADREDLADEEDQHPSFPVNVTVLIRRPDDSSKGALRFDLVAEDGAFMIQQLTHLPPSTASAIEQIRSSYDGKQNLYSGPPFEQLDEEVQGHLEEYISARGVDSNLASAVPDYIDSKEQKEYLAWLGRVRNFVA